MTANQKVDPFAKYGIRVLNDEVEERKAAATKVANAFLENLANNNKNVPKGIILGGAKKPATKKPATKKPTTKKPATKKPAAKKPAAKKPAAKKRTTKK